MKNSVKKSAAMMTFLMLLALLILLATQVVAWFNFADSNSADFGLRVFGSSESGPGGVENVEITHGTISSVAADTVLIYPGQSITVKVDIKNQKSEQATFNLTVNNLSVLYPTSAEDFSFPKKYIYTNQYYTANNTTKFDISEIADEQDFFKSFVAPFSNALKYEVYMEDMTAFHSNYVDKYVSALPNANSTQIMSPNYSSVATDLPMTISSYASTTPSHTVNDGGIVLAADEATSLYVVFYFDEAFCPTAVYDEQIITLRNSNPYMNQKLKLKLGYTLT